MKNSFCLHNIRKKYILKRSEKGLNVGRVVDSNLVKFYPLTLTFQKHYKITDSRLKNNINF